MTDRKTELVNTHQLAEGDTILFYGALLKLANRKVWPMRQGDNPVTQGECITFHGELVGNDAGAIPRGWFNRVDGKLIWNVQGNRLATWSRVID